MDTTIIRPYFDCDGGLGATTIVGLNSFKLRVENFSVADVVSVAGTLQNDGIVHIPSLNGTGVFVVSSTNIGNVSESVVVKPSDKPGDGSSHNVPAILTICQTNPTTGICLQPPSADVEVFIPRNFTRTFGIFVKGEGVHIPLDPANKRIFVTMEDRRERFLGETSLAVTTQ